MSIISLDTISKFLKGLMAPPTPLPPITKLQISLGMPLRPGLSAQKIWSRIASKKGDAGLPQVPSEEDLAMEMIRIEAIVDALLTDAKIEVVIPEGQIKVTVYTITPAGPTPLGFGINDQPVIGQAKGSGIIR